MRWADECLLNGCGALALQSQTTQRLPLNEPPDCLDCLHLLASSLLSSPRLRFSTFILPALSLLLSPPTPTFGISALPAVFPNTRARPHIHHYQKTMPGQANAPARGRGRRGAPRGNANDGIAGAARQLAARNVSSNIRPFQLSIAFFLTCFNLMPISTATSNATLSSVSSPNLWHEQEAQAPSIDHYKH